MGDISTATRATRVEELVRGQVRQRPAACAVREPWSGRTLTYRELWDRAGRLAGYLAGTGVTRGEPVAVSLPRSADLVVTMLGVVRAGAAYLPLDDHAPAARVATILDEAKAGLVVLMILNSTTLAEAALPQARAATEATASIRIDFASMSFPPSAQGRTAGRMQHALMMCTMSTIWYTINITCYS